MRILFITHNLGVVAEIAHEVVVMYAGRVVEHAPVGDLFDRQKHPYTQGCSPAFPTRRADRSAAGERLRLNPIPGNVPNVLRFQKVAASRRAVLTASMLRGGSASAHGRSPSHQPVLEARDPMTASDMLLRVEGLTKHFPPKGGMVKAVEGVSFDVRRGTIVGLVGESGSGKTTAGRCTLRLIEPSEGRILFDGVDLRTVSGQRDAHLSPPHADRLSGSLFEPQSAHAG